MALTIWKYPLDIRDLQSIVVPYGSTFLSVLEQDNQPVMYFVVDKSPASMKLKKQITWVHIFGTGHPLTPEAIEGTIEHRGTISTHNGQHVWHIFM